ncbi:MAG: hypothetical protein ACWGQW_17880 [bacterium]
MPRPKRRKQPGVKRSPATSLTKGNRAKPRKGTPARRKNRSSVGVRSRKSTRTRSKANIGTKSTAKVTGAQPKVYRGRHEATKAELRAYDKKNKIKGKFIPVNIFKSKKPKRKKRIGG